MCVEMNSTLRVTLSHPYIGESGANDFREMQRLIWKSMEATCTVQESRGCVLEWWSACSLRTLCPIPRGLFTQLHGIGRSGRSKTRAINSASGTLV